MNQLSSYKENNTFEGSEVSEIYKDTSEKNEDEINDGNASSSFKGEINSFFLDSN